LKAGRIVLKPFPEKYFNFLMHFLSKYGMFKATKQKTTGIWLTSCVVRVSEPFVVDVNQICHARSSVKESGGSNVYDNP